MACQRGGNSCCSRWLLGERESGRARGYLPQVAIGVGEVPAVASPRGGFRGFDENSYSYLSSRPRTTFLLTEKQMFPVTFRPERTLERKCSASGIPPHESVVAVYVMFDLPTADKRVGANGMSNPPPEYASVMLMMKNWSPALGGGLNLFHFRTDRVAFGTLLLTLSFQPSLSGRRSSVLIRYGLARVQLEAAAGAEAAATRPAMSRHT